MKKIQNRRWAVCAVLLSMSQLVAGCFRPMVVEGFSTPESAIHDVVRDVYLVSNIHGSPFGEDGKAGFISRILPDGSIDDLKWIDGGEEGVELGAPKGLAIVGDVLYVADVTALRMFDLTSGKPLGSITIPDVSFLNDVAASTDGTVYVSDTGMGPGFVETESDAIYAINPGGEVRTLAKGVQLGNPNGLLVVDDSVLKVSWALGTFTSFAPDGASTELAKLPATQLDGLVEEAPGSYLISSWEGSCIYRVVDDGSIDACIKDVDAPADIGWDAERGRLLIPLFNENKLRIVEP